MSLSNVIFPVSSNNHRLCVICIGEACLFLLDFRFCAECFRARHPLAPFEEDARAESLLNNYQTSDRLWNIM